MTPRQAHALAHPLPPGTVAVDRRLWRINGELRVASALAVVHSSADPGPAWHVACARIDGLGRPLPVERTGRGLRSLVDMAEHVLAGVGLPGRDDWERTPHMVHLRRPLSPAEASLLPPGWLSLSPDRRR